MENHARRAPANPGVQQKKFRGVTASAAEPDYQLVFDSAADGLALVHADTGEMMNVNRTFAKLSGYPLNELVGRKFGEVPAIRGTDTQLILTQVRKGRECVFSGDLQIETKDGKRIDVELLCSAYRAEGGDIVLCNVRDVTERKRIERARFRSKDQFRRLFEGHQQPMWVFEKDSLAFLAVNEGAIQLFGYSREEFMSMTVRDVLIPGEVPDFLDSIGNARSPLLQPDIWKLRKKSGAVIDVEIASNELQFGGRDARFVVASDVTARKQAEDLLRESRRLLQDMLNALPIGVMITDSKGSIIIKNPAMKKIWGGEQGVGRDRYDEYTGQIADPEKQNTTKEGAAARVLLEGKTTLDEMIDIVDFDGKQKTILNFAVPLRDSPGNIAGAIIVNQDITERRRQEEELKRVDDLLKRQATTDTLTGIFNRLKFNELLDMEMREALRYKHPLSLIMFDVDHFKSINDAHGHLVGDSVLKEITGLIKAHIRNVDIFARWGGEEFVILSPDSSLSSVRRVAEKLRQLIALTDFSCPSRVTVSFGLAQFQEDDVIDSFVKRADDALYRAKDLGRNRVEPY